MPRSGPSHGLCPRGGVNGPSRADRVAPYLLLLVALRRPLITRRILPLDAHEGGVVSLRQRQQGVGTTPGDTGDEGRRQRRGCDHRNGPTSSGQGGPRIGPLPTPPTAAANMAIVRDRSSRRWPATVDGGNRPQWSRWFRRRRNPAGGVRSPALCGASTPTRSHWRTRRQDGRGLVTPHSARVCGSTAPGVGLQHQNGAGPRPTTDINTCVASTLRTLVTATAPICS